jgi:hypothetical protein
MTKEQSLGNTRQKQMKEVVDHNQHTNKRKSKKGRILKCDGMETFKQWLGVDRQRRAIEQTQKRRQKIKREKRGQNQN